MKLRKIALVAALGVHFFAWAIISQAQGWSHGTSTAPHVPLVMCNGGFIPQGTPCGASGNIFNNGYNGGFIPRQPRYVIVQQPAYYPAQHYPHPGMGVQNPSTNCAAIGAIAGGTLGSLNRAHPAQAAILGAIAGGTLGSMLCMNQNGHVARYGDYRQDIGQTTMPSKCSFENGVVAHTYEGQAGCDKIAAAMARPVVSQVPPASQADPCADQAGRIAVIRANGQVACRQIGTPAEPGERPYQ